MSTMVFYCWCHSDSASVLLYFTLLIYKKIPTSIFEDYNVVFAKYSVYFNPIVKLIRRHSFGGLQLISFF